MVRFLSSALFLCVSGAFVCAAQSTSGSGQTSQAQPTAAAPTTQAAGKSAAAQTSEKNSAKAKKKPKKVWTEDNISKVGGGISVVGDASSASAANSSAESEGGTPPNSTHSREIEYYRGEIRRLQAQMDETDKKIEDLRNFKGENTSSSGGINPNHGYTMTPVADQIKQLEEQKKQIQDRMDAVMDEARKNGIEPGQLR